jgi:hypothetical protein
MYSKLASDGNYGNKYDGFTEDRKDCYSSVCSY